MAVGILMLIDNVLKSQAFKLKGRLFTFTVLQLLELNPSEIASQLREMVSKAPKMFENTPVVLDCSSVNLEQFNLSAIYTVIRDQGVLPIAIQGGNAFINTCAQALGLAILNASSSNDKSLMMETTFEAPVTTSIFKPKRVSSPIRSGQQVVSKGADLIITASVSYGAEILSEGNIHVYGALRGKALAGIAGDKEARIFCQSLDAELISIAGFYLLRESMERYTSPCQIYLQDDQIKIDLL